MKRFKIFFQTVVHDENGDEKGTGMQTVRVIAAEDRKTAQRIGRGMYEEEVNIQEFLGDVILIEETGEDYAMVSWDIQETWDRTLEKMGLDRRNVDWVYSDKVPDEIVGIKLK